jgi:hypothetical protein
MFYQIKLNSLEVGFQNRARNFDFTRLLTIQDRVNLSAFFLKASSSIDLAVPSSSLRVVGFYFAWVCIFTF